VDGKIEGKIISFATPEETLLGSDDRISYKDYYNGVIDRDQINFILTSDRPWEFAPQDFVAVRKKE
jgi:hypothetical protein